MVFPSFVSCDLFSILLIVGLCIWEVLRKFVTCLLGGTECFFFAKSTSSSWVEGGSLRHLPQNIGIAKV